MGENTTSDQIVEEYLSDLRAALRSVNTSSGHEFVFEIEQHIAEGRATLEAGDEVGLRNLLERIGSPTSLANELQETEPARSVRAMDRATPWLIMFGGFAFGFGWIVGLYGLWSSRTWRIWDKLLGTFIWPGGLLGSFYLFVTPMSVTACSGSGGPGPAPATITCVRHGLGVLPGGLQFLVGFVVVAAPILTSLRLASVLVHGYADSSNPTAIRVLRTSRSRKNVRAAWIIAALMTLVFFIFVQSRH